MPARGRTIRQNLAGWPGVGRIVAGMARQQYDLRLTRSGSHGWEATFYPEGIGHSLTPMVGSELSRPGLAVPPSPLVVANPVRQRSTCDSLVSPPYYSKGNSA